MTETGQPTRRSWRFVALAVALLAAGGGYYWWQAAHSRAAAQKSAATPRPAVPVSVMSVKSSRYEVQLEGLGSVQPINTVLIKSRVDGQIEQVFFKEGEMVKEGELLLRIDPRPYKAALDGALAKLAQDQATLNNAKLDLQRYSTLVQQQVTSVKQLDSQQAAVASGTAQVQSDQAAIDNAKVQLGYTEIRAPLSGRIGFRQVDSGNIVRASDTQALLSIVQVDPINVLYTLPEGDLQSVQQAFTKGPVQVIASVNGQQRNASPVTGRIAVINNQVDQASGTVQIKAVYDNKDMRLWPGQSVTTKTRVDTLENVIVIPASTIQHGPEGLFVWRIDDDGAALPDKIKVSDQDTSNAVVTSGLSVGDRIVTAGQLRLRKGVKVEAKDATDQQARLGAGATQ